MPFAHLGGAETYTRHTAQFHDRAQFEPIYCLLCPGPLVDALRDHGASVHVLAPPFTGMSPWEVTRVVRWLGQISRQAQPALIHSSLAYGAVLGALVAWHQRVPHVWFQQGPVTWRHRIAGYLPARAMYVNSDFTERSQRRVEGVVGAVLTCQRRVTVLPLGVDLAEAERWRAARKRQRVFWRQRWGLLPTDRVVGMVCRIARWKGVDVFIRAVSYLRWGGCSVHGVVIGAPDEASRSYAERLQHLAASLEGAVKFVGQTAEPLAAMTALDALVNASVIPEPFGISLLEGMSLGLPVVAPREGGPLELIRDGVTGFLFIPRSAESLASAMWRAIDPAEMRVGQKARDYVAANFGAEASIRRLEDEYRALLCP